MNTSAYLHASALHCGRCPSSHFPKLHSGSGQSPSAWHWLQCIRKAKFCLSCCISPGPQDYKTAIKASRIVSSHEILKLEPPSFSNKLQLLVEKHANRLAVKDEQLVSMCSFPLQEVANVTGHGKYSGSKAIEVCVPQQAKHIMITQNQVPEDYLQQQFNCGVCRSCWQSSRQIDLDTFPGPFQGFFDPYKIRPETSAYCFSKACSQLRREGRLGADEAR
jgi:hypothetical protein